MKVIGKISLCPGIQISLIGRKFCLNCSHFSGNPFAFYVKKLPFVLPLMLQVKTWFQNRRMKGKRKQAEDVERKAKLASINNLALNMNHGYQGRPYQPPPYQPSPYTGRSFVLRHDLKPEYAYPPVFPWNNQLRPYSSPPPYWASYPGPYPAHL